VSLGDAGAVGGGGEQPETDKPFAESFAVDAPRPLGIVSTFGWLIAAVVAAMVAAVLVALVSITVFAVDHDEARSDRIGMAAWTVYAAAASLFFTVVIVACRRSGWRAADYLGLARPKGHYVLAGATAFLLTLLFALIAVRFGPLGYGRSRATTVAEVVTYLVETMITAPFFEELIYRGFLYRGLAASRLGVTGAIIATTVLWTAIHSDRTLLGYAALLVMGIALGWLRWRSASTIPTISVHFVYNLCSVAIPLIWSGG